MTAFHLAVQMALLMLVGFMSGKLKIVDEKFGPSLAGFIYNIIFPCVVFRSMLRDFDLSKISDMSLLVIISVLTMGLMALFGIGINLVFKKNDNLSRIMIMNLMFTNFTYMAFPVMEALFGDTGNLYIVAYTTPVRILFYIVTPILFIVGRGKESENCEPKIMGKTVLLALLSPPVLAVPIGFFFYFTKMPFPESLLRAVDSLASAATPMGMALCGVTLTGIPLLKMFADKRVIFISLLRLVAAPAIVTAIFYLITRQVSLDPIIVKVSVVYCALPAAAASAVIAMKAKADEVKAAQCVLITTLLSVLTLPVWVFISERLF